MFSLGIQFKDRGLLVSSKVLSYDSGTSSVPLVGKTIGTLFDEIAGRLGEQTGFVSRHQDIRWTYNEYKEQVDSLAAGFIELGLEPGDRIGIWSQNNAEWVVTQFATAKAGLVLVSLNPAYRTSELEYALNKVDCKALVLSPVFKTSQYLDILAELAPELATCQPGALESKVLPSLKIVIRMGEEKTPGMYNYAEVQQKATASSKESKFTI